MTLRRRSAQIEYRQRRTEEREANMRVLASTKGRAAVYGGETAAAPKPEAYRDPALLEMARDRPCLLLVPMVCQHRVDTVVACHSNHSFHGKAGARKADDVYSVWGCSACHAWLDQGTADRIRKGQAFMEAHVRQIMAWRQVAADPSEPERFRNAAIRALERLNAGPVVEI